MDKKNYLSHTEQMFWEQISSKQFIDTELIELIFPDYSKSFIYKILHSLYRKGYLKKARKNFYYIQENITSYWDIALKIHKGYLGLSSALRFHNLIDYEDFRIFIMTKDKRDKTILEHHDICYIPLKEHFCGFKKYGNYLISTPEKTIFDSFLKTGLIGYDIITKALYDADSFDWKKFISYFRKSQNLALHQRTGYILEIMHEELNLKIPGFVFDYLISKKGNSARLGSVKGKSVFSSKWNIQDNIGKKTIFGWWS